MTLGGFSPTPVATQTALRLDAITYVAGRTLLDDVSVSFTAKSSMALWRGESSAAR